MKEVQSGREIRLVEAQHKHFLVLFELTFVSNSNSVVLKLLDLVLFSHPHSAIFVIHDDVQIRRGTQFPHRVRSHCYFIINLILKLRASMLDVVNNRY